MRFWTLTENKNENENETSMMKEEKMQMLANFLPKGNIKLYT